MATIVRYQTKSGHQLEFYVHSISSVWPRGAGIYMMCSGSPSTSYNPVYIGQASSFADRLAAHEKMAPAKARGANFVLLASVSSQQMRDLLERSLIQELNPPLNEYLKPRLF